MTTDLVGAPDPVALVTGGGWNIGRAIACRLAAAGARVVVASRRRDRLEATVARIRAAGGVAIAVPADVTRPGEVDALVATTAGEFGDVDILVAAAGGSGAHAALDAVDPADWHDVVARNLFGAFHAARSVLPAMRRRNRGVILTVTGGGAFFPLLGAHATAYATAKAALYRFTDQLQAELLDTAIRVNCIEPGMVWDPDALRTIEAEEARTGRPHEGRSANHPPEAAAELAGFLASTAGAGLRGRVVSVDDAFWHTPERVRAVAETEHLYRLRRADEG